MKSRLKGEVRRWGWEALDLLGRCCLNNQTCHSEGQGEERQEKQL